MVYCSEVQKIKISIAIDFSICNIYNKKLFLSTYLYVHFPLSDSASWRGEAGPTPGFRHTRRAERADGWGFRVTARCCPPPGSLLRSAVTWFLKRLIGVAWDTELGHQEGVGAESAMFFELPSPWRPSLWNPPGPVAPTSTPSSPWGSSRNELPCGWQRTGSASHLTPTCWSQPWDWGGWCWEEGREGTKGVTKGACQVTNKNGVGLLRA